MKRSISVTCLFLFAIALSAIADDGDDTLNFYLSKTDCVLKGTIVSEPVGINDESGVVEYLCDFKVSETFKGDVLTNGVTTRVVIARFEKDASDRHPLIKKGGEYILFLKNASPSIPKWRTVDFWFGVQHPSRPMGHSIRRLADAESNWLDIIDKVAIRIEMVLYEKKDHPNFFIHVEVRNQAPYEIGVDLSEKWMVLYPNQWGGSDLDYRTVVNEKVVPPKKLDIQLRARLIEAFKSKRLTLLPPGKSIDYYSNFNASGRKDIQAAIGKFILISIKGQLVFTDGSDVWDMQPSRDLAIKKPVTWKTVPKNAIVIER